MQASCSLTSQLKRLAALKEMFRQQSTLAQKKEVKHRIVSIDRPYIRPIGRRVEFGSKVNNIQIDGISFIEYHSFEAFNEGVCRIAARNSRSETLSLFSASTWQTPPYLPPGNLP